MGVRLSFFLCIEGIEALNAVLYYKGKGEVFSEKQAYHFPLYLNRHIEKEIYFPYPAEAVRLDLSDQNVVVKIEKLEIASASSENALNALKENMGQLGRKEKIAVLTHDMSNTGAPLLAYHIAEKLKENGRDVVVLAANHGDGFLEEKYAEKEIPIFYLHDNARNQISVGWCGTKGESKKLGGRRISGAFNAAFERRGILSSDYEYCCVREVCSSFKTVWIFYCFFDT